jgi:hypothetical protein
VLDGHCGVVSTADEMGRTNGTSGGGHNAKASVHGKEEKQPLLKSSSPVSPPRSPRSPRSPYVANAIYEDGRPHAGVLNGSTDVDEDGEEDDGSGGGVPVSRITFPNHGRGGDNIMSPLASPVPQMEKPSSVVSLQVRVRWLLVLCTPD